MHVRFPYLARQCLAGHSSPADCNMRTHDVAKNVTTLLPVAILPSFPVPAFVFVHGCLPSNPLWDSFKPNGLKGILVLLCCLSDCPLFHLQPLLLSICLHTCGVHLSNAISAGILVHHNLAAVIQQVPAMLPSVFKATRYQGVRQTHRLKLQCRAGLGCPATRFITMLQYFPGMQMSSAHCCFTARSDTNAKHMTPGATADSLVHR